MNELVKVTKNEQGSQVVSARELHEYLEVGRQFSKWISKYMIDSPYFAENEDYVVLANNGYNLDGGRPQVNYAITIDTAKKLAMTVNSERGNDVRNYFLQCEKELQQSIVQLPDFTNPAIAARAWADEVEQKQKVIEEKKVLEIQAAQDAPKLEVYEGLIDTEQLVSMQTAANNLNVGLITLYSYLRKRKILKSSHGQKNLPYQTYIDRGYFEVKSKPYKNSITGSSGISFNTYVTGLGMAWLEQNLPDNM
jgi:phage anti-repressor protein/phage antirepressor YoqD-like protein